MASIGDLIVRIGADISGFANAFKSVSDTLDDFTDKIQKSFDSVGSLGEKMGRTGAILSAAITAPLVGVGKAAIDTAASFETTQLAFTTLMHNSAGAEQMLKKLYAFTANTPFQIQGVLQGARTLTAMGFKAEQIIPLMRTLGDAASGLGLGQQGLERLIYHFGQIESLGHIDGRVLRELGQAGIAAGQMLADGLGVTTARVAEMIEHKMIDADTAIKLLTKGMDAAFGGGMEARMKSFSGMLSNLKDNMTYTADAIGQQLLPAAKMVLEVGGQLTEAIRGVAELFGELPEPIKVTALGLLALAAAVGPVTLGIGGLLYSIGAIATSIPIMTAGVIAGANAVRMLGIFAVQTTLGLTSNLIPGLTTVTVTSTAAATAIGLISKALWYVTAAMVGWKVGRWLDENWATMKKADIEFTNLLKSIPGVQAAMDKLSGATKEAAADQEALRFAAERLQASLKAHNIVVKQGSLSLEEFTVKLKEAAHAADGTASIASAAAAMVDIQKKTKAAAEELKAATGALALIKKSFKDGSASAADLAEATERYHAALAAAHPELHATGIAAAKVHAEIKTLDVGLLEAQVRWDEYKVAMQAARAAFINLSGDIVTGRLGDAMRATGEKAVKMANDMKAAFSMMKTAGDEGPSKALEALNQAFSMLGMKSAAQLEADIGDLEAAFDTVANSGVLSAAEIDVALDKLNEKIKNLRQGQTKGNGFDFINKVSDDFGSSIQKMLDGTMRFHNAWRTMTLGLARDFTSQLSKMAGEWISMETRKLLMTVLTNTGIVSSNVGAAAQSKAASNSLMLSEVLNGAKKAAASAYAATADIPIVGPVLAPVAAAGAFAAVMALGVVSAEHGAVLPNYSTVGFLHPNEMVLPSGISKGLQSMIANGGSGGGSVALHQQVNYNGHPKMSKSELENLHASTIRSAMRTFRNNGFGRK